MKGCLLILLGLGVMMQNCHAEPRWCSISELGPSNKFFYPPIGVAARVQGVVLGRIIYKPNEKMLRFEEISGPRLLSSLISGELTDWTMKSDAVGSELCQTLVIASFKLTRPGGSKPEEPKFSLEGSVLRLSMEAEPAPIDALMVDPAPLSRCAVFRLQVRAKLRQLAGYNPVLTNPR
jgi:hypothetical protein